VATGVAARFEIAGPPVLTAATRDTDSPPFNAAGFMVRHLSDGTYTWCSSGFAINDVAGRSHTTTARHCTEQAYRAADGTYMYGQTVTMSGSGAAREQSAGGFYWMFDGPYNTSTKRTVVGLRDVSLGDYVCTSGGNSGSHCGLQINDMAFWLNDGSGLVETIQAVNWTYHGIAAAKGDSGGGVLVHSGANVYAVGMLQAGDNACDDWSCPSGTVHTPATCYSYTYFTSMRVIVNTMPGGATLLTGPPS